MFNKIKQLFSRHQEDTEDSYEFVWGIKSASDITDYEEANIYTIDNLDIFYDKESKSYILSIETLYLFTSGQEQEKRYIRNLFNKLTEWMNSKGFDTTQELNFHDVFCTGLNINSEFESLEQLYATFKFLVKGFCSETNELLTDNHHLDLNRVFEEIEFLYNTYGKEDDKKLTQDAIELKRDILDFVYQVKML